MISRRRYYIPVMLLSSTLLLASPLQAAEPTDAHKAEAVTAIKALGKQLKTRLQAAMKKGGPVAAISECKTVATPIARDISLRSSMEVGRTSLKLRNPGNAPDDWEKAVLEQFEARKAKGESLKTMAHAEVIEQGGKRQFRFLKPIPTGSVCLACHGSNVNPDTAKQLDKLYPQDQARGFNEGDIRGAFTVTKELY